MERSRPHLTLRRALLILISLSCVLVVVSVLSLSIGSSELGVADLWDVMTGSGHPTSELIFWELRLPRLLLAILVGSGLSAAGAVLQSLLRNPLAEPYILGISSGGTAGAMIGMLLGAGGIALALPVISFLGSALVMLLVFSLGHRGGILDPNALLLSGVMVGAFFNAMILVAVAVFHQELRTAYLWLLGNLGGADMPMLYRVGPPMIIASIALVGISRPMNLIATGDESALQAGVDVGRIRTIGYLLASLITGFAVSASGVIGFVGLLVPHVCRLLFGSDNRIVVPASLLAGAAFLAACDILSRLVLAPAEIPVGAITAALGAPVFIYLLKR